ncbi:MAG: bifunctional oligoribonuclease/PAP phosphatase NrnA [Opitutales bacterium]
MMMPPKDPPYFPEHHTCALALLEALKGHNAAVVSHARPDGDCVGAAVALTRMLNAKSISAIAINQHPVPARLTSFIKGTPLRFGATELNGDSACVYVDCAGAERAGEQLAPKLPQALGNLDHHVTNPAFARYNLVAHGATATCELIAGLAFDLGWPVDATTASALYLGLFTDTGGFRYAALSARTFALAAWLIERGADPGRTAYLLTVGKPWGSLDLLERFLGSRARFCEGRLAVARIAQADFKVTETTPEDADDFPGMMVVAEGVTIAAAFEELSDGRWKCSLRATDEAARVDRIAETYGGGGHPCAAGFTLPEPVDVFQPAFVEAIERHLREQFPEN